VDNQLKTSGITDRRLLVAMGEVPREKFVPPARRPLAYIDEAHRLSPNRQLGAPAPFANLVQLAAIAHTDRVLDVGCGTGYSTAVLAQLAGHVVAVEGDAELLSQARSNLAELGVPNVSVVDGPLLAAGEREGPYDVIILEGAVAAVPDELLGQLKDEGRLVALIATPGNLAVAHLFARSGDGIGSSLAFDAKLPPLLPQADNGFVF
jgi:protein-L-isoaspartate(D-aspartate) O-methyltransferase